MKLEKRVDHKKHVDNYVLSITHQEADAAFDSMTPGERVMVKELQESREILVLLKVLMFWAQKVEEVHTRLGDSQI